MSNGNNGGYKAPPREPTVLDDPKLKLFAPNRDGKKATLAWGVFNGQPRITIWTNLEADRDKGSIQAAMSQIACGMLFGLLRTAIAFVPTETDKEFRKNCDNKAVRWVNKKPDGQMVVSKTVVGKNVEGVVYIAVVNDKHEKLKFEILPDEWHYFTNSDGTPFGKGELSVLCAESYVDIIDHHCKFLSARDYKAPPKKDAPNAGGSSGGYNNNNNNNRSNYNSGGNNPPNNQHDEDDIPF